MMSDNEQKKQDEGLSLEEIMKEFSGDREIREASAEDILRSALTEAGVAVPEPEKAEPAEQPEAPDIPAEEEKTLRFHLPEQMGDTAEFVPVTDSREVPEDPDTTRRLDLPEQPEENAGENPPEEEKAEPFSEQWEPEYDQPIADYVPPQPIVFRPRSRLRELKRKLVAGPEKRYYELSERGLGRLQSAIFLSVIIALISGGALLLYGIGMVAPQRIRLMVFGQVLCMLMAGLLGIYQMMEGLESLFKGRFTADTMLTLAFIACCADGLVCLWQKMVPYCGVFTLAVTMSLWGEHQRRSAEMGQMDTMRRAVRLDSLVKVPDLYDGRPGFLRGEGQVEDFMEHYREPETPRKVVSVYLACAAGAAAAAGVAGGILLGWQQGIRLWAAAMLAGMPAGIFITHSRPMAVLERRLHRAGAVICGWRGVRGLCGPAVVPLKDGDLFPAGSVKMNGVKFFGSRDPDQVIAYTAAVAAAEGTGLTGLFDHLLDSRNGRHYEAENFRAYAGGLGGEVCQEPVLVGTQDFLRDMGVEVPEGTRVQSAVYTAVDGELCGVFALTYGKTRGAAAGLASLCGYRSLTPVLICGDFMLTESFLRNIFRVNTRRIAFPVYEVRKNLQAAAEEPEGEALALMTREDLSGAACAVAGARNLRTAMRLGTVMHLTAGILGIAVVAVLGVLRAVSLLTAENLLLFQLFWLVPGFLITEWARNR